MMLHSLRQVSRVQGVNLTSLKHCGFLSLRKSFFSTERSTEQLVTTEIDYKTGIAILTMNNKPVNSLSLEMLDAMRENITSLEVRIVALSLRELIPFTSI